MSARSRRTRAVFFELVDSVATAASPTYRSSPLKPTSDLCGTPTSPQGVEGRDADRSRGVRREAGDPSPAQTRAYDIETKPHRPTNHPRRRRGADAYPRWYRAASDALLWPPSSLRTISPVSETSMVFSAPTSIP